MKPFYACNIFWASLSVTLLEIIEVEEGANLDHNENAFSRITLRYFLRFFTSVVSFLKYFYPTHCIHMEICYCAVRVLFTRRNTKNRIQWRAVVCVVERCCVCGGEV